METAMGYCGTVGVDGVRDEVMERLRGACDELGYTIKLRSKLPEFYIWMDKENSILYVSDDARKIHIIEFIRYLKSSVKAEAKNSLNIPPSKKPCINCSI